ncbi:2-isopropylmalate synthase [Armillaria mellea]|nr:2-isopropylmalate synthase [Armillaria mellea]
MPMLPNPAKKYLPYPAVNFPPNYYLRDGNQALVNPMNNTTKLELFRLLVDIGFKEIEVAYPSAADLEYQFVRSLIEHAEIPDDVAIQIITPARSDLITKSISSLSGAKHAIIHLYNAVSPVFREVVFRNTKEQTIDLTLNAVRLVKQLTEEETARSGTRFMLNYCLETFSQTEPEFTVELGNRVLAEWGKASPDDKVIFNLAATVECAPSNHYADMVEYFANHINQRDSVILSIHPHNDRGTAVAAAELGLLAGGTRVEGCLLGNGERTGNVDLISLALNLYSQGISPHLDFSNLPEIVKTVCRCNEMSVPLRYPYAGNLVFSAFAGTHQDAIKKGLDSQAKRWGEVDRSATGIKHWAVPYIPLDPKDIGYGYENLIRVSSQSGKAGTAYVIKQTMQLDLPRRMQMAFYWYAFKRTYSIHHRPINRLFLQSYSLFPLSPSSKTPSSPASDYSDDLSTLSSAEDNEAHYRFEGHVIVDGALHVPRPGTHHRVSTLQQMVNTTNNAPKAATFLEMRGPDGESAWGVGIADSVTASKCRAVISAANGLIADRPIPRKMIFTPRPLPSSESAIRELASRCQAEDRTRPLAYTRAGEDRVCQDGDVGLSWGRGPYL